MKKEYFMNNVPVGALSLSAFAGYALYGAESDYAYIAYVVDDKIQSCHKLMVHYTKDGSAFVILHGKRLHISEFI